MLLKSILGRLNSNLIYSTGTKLNFKSTTILASRKYSKDSDKDQVFIGKSDSNKKNEKSGKDLIKTEDDRIESKEQQKLSIYDQMETVEDVRARLRRESEICYTSQASLYNYPAGWNYALKFDRIFDLEKKDVKPFKDLNAASLAVSNVLIIGGGLIGTSVAYWLRELGLDMIDVNIIDRDFNHLHSNTGLSASGLQQQFTTRECIELSQFSAEFLRTIRRNCNVFNKEPPDVDYCPTGNLILCKAENVEQFLKDVGLQNELGQKTILLNKEQLKEQFPWLNCEDVEMGSIGLENEGHFNSQALLRAMKIKAENLHARFWECEFVDFNLNLITVQDAANRIIKLERCRRALVRDKGNELFQIDFDHVVIAAGPENAKFGRLFKYFYKIR